jgi:MGT family glycosyltransferase
VEAERPGLPHAAVQVTASRLAPNPAIGHPLNRLRAAHGLPDDPGLAMLHRHLVLSPFPPSYRDPAEIYPATVRVIRPVPFDRSGTEQLPAWVAHLPPQPTVYLTLGTAYNDRVAIFTSFVEGLCDEPLNLIVTVGRDQDPSGFGRLPPNVRIERYIPQSQLFPHCDLVVTHGGSGTVIGAFVHGLPLVVVPMSNDQSGNAVRCAALGVGHVVPWATMTAATARAAVLRVLRDPSYRRNAEQLRTEIGTMPAPAHAVALLERLAVERTLAA